MIHTVLLYCNLCMYSERLGSVLLSVKNFLICIPHLGFCITLKIIWVFVPLKIYEIEISNGMLLNLIGKFHAYEIKGHEMIQQNRRFEQYENNTGFDEISCGRTSVYYSPQ